MRRIPSHSDLLLYKAMTEYREVQKLTFAFFKNAIFEKRESQFTIIKYADIVN